MTATATSTLEQLTNDRKLTSDSASLKYKYFLYYELPPLPTLPDNGPPLLCSICQTLTPIKPKLWQYSSFVIPCQPSFDAFIQSSHHCHSCRFFHGKLHFVAGFCEKPPESYSKLPISLLRLGLDLLLCCNFSRITLFDAFEKGSSVPVSWPYRTGTFLPVGGPFIQGAASRPGCKSTPTD